MNGSLPRHLPPAGTQPSLNASYPILPYPSSPALHTRASTHSWYGLGFCYFSQGAFVAAERAFLRASELCPRDRTVLCLLGETRGQSSLLCLFCIVFFCFACLFVFVSICFVPYYFIPFYPNLSLYSTPSYQLLPPSVSLFSILSLLPYYLILFLSPIPTPYLICTHIPSISPHRTISPRRRKAETLFTTGGP